jgi:hypothetical protein
MLKRPVEVPKKYPNAGTVGCKFEGKGRVWWCVERSRMKEGKQQNG